MVCVCVCRQASDGAAVSSLRADYVIAELKGKLWKLVLGNIKYSAWSSLYLYFETGRKEVCVCVCVEIRAVVNAFMEFERALNYFQGH